MRRHREVVLLHRMQDRVTSDDHAANAAHSKRDGANNELAGTAGQQQYGSDVADGQVSQKQGGRPASLSSGGTSTRRAPATGMSMEADRTVQATQPDAQVTESLPGAFTTYENERLSSIRQDDEQNASHGTLMLEKDGRSQYLGPTAGSEWLKDVIVDTVNIQDRKTNDFSQR